MKIAGVKFGHADADGGIKIYDLKNCVADRGWIKINAFLWFVHDYLRKRYILKCEILEKCLHEVEIDFKKGKWYNKSR